MLQQVNPTESQSAEWICQAVSPLDEPCDAKATHYCEVCERWFCELHARDEEWHTCMLEPGDEGGEG